MIILITGASHTGKTLLAQRMLENCKYPYLSIDHLKMGLIRSGNTDLTPEDDDKLTEYLGLPRYDIDANSVASPFIHDTSKKISEVFRKAIQSAPSVLVIDEMEAFLSDRSAAGLSGTHHMEEVAEFLRKIPEAKLPTVYQVYPAMKIPDN